jgi:hypothetical protein
MELEILTCDLRANARRIKSDLGTGIESGWSLSGTPERLDGARPRDRRAPSNTGSESANKLSNHRNLLGIARKMRGKRFRPELNLVCSPERPSVVVTSCPAGNFRALIVVVLK